MLDFIYKGAYDVNSDSVETYCEPLLAEATSGALELCQVHDVDPIIVHVQVYGIADYYQLDGLKEQALANFTDPELPINMDNFPELIRAVYSTAPAGDPLRKEFLTLTEGDLQELLGDDRFVHELTTDPGLQEFAADLLMVTCKDAGGDNMPVQAHRAMLLNTTEALADKEAELAWTKMQYEGEAAQVSEMLQAQKALEQAYEKLDARFDEEAAKVQKLQKELNDANQSAAQARAETAKARVEQEESYGKAWQARKELLQANGDLAHIKRERDEARTAASEHLNEAARARKERDQALADKTQVAQQLARTTQTLENSQHGEREARSAHSTVVQENRRVRKGIREALKMVEDLEECRNCKTEQAFYLDYDDRVRHHDALMLCCGKCKRRHYGRLVNINSG
jgi:hypothetical protein